MKLWILFLSLFLSSQALAVPRARQVVFKNVPETLLSELRKKYPQVFTPQATYADYDEVMRRLMATGQFEDMNVESDIEGDTENIQIIGKRIRKLLSYSIDGASQLSRSEIRTLLDLHTNQPFARKKLVDGAEKLKERYGEMGYLNASIEIDFKSAGEDEVVASIKIQEGEPSLIYAIEVETPNKILKASLMRRIGRQLRRPLTEERVNGMRETIDHYFSYNRYLNAQVSQPKVEYNETKTQATITFLIENPERYELIFDGNKALTSPTLLRHLDLENYPRTTLNPPLDISNRLVEIYKEKGFAFAQVNYKEVRFDKKFLRRAYYKIKENRRVRIHSLEVTGQMTRASDYYADFIRQSSSDVVADGYFHRVGLDQGLKNLQIELQNQGFLQAKVSAVRINFSDDKRDADITAILEEGPQTLIKEITFKGNATYPAVTLRQQITLNEKSPLRLSEVESSIQALKDFYTSRGYLEMSIANENQELVLYNQDNTEASLVFDIVEGPQVHINRVVIEGNAITKDYVILREVELKKGDLLTPEKITESIGRLQRLGLFSTVSIFTVEQGTNISNRTVVISVVESNPGLFNSGIGFTDEANLSYRGYFGLAYRNIAGTARAFSSRMELNYSSDPRINYLEHKLQFAYLEPFLFDTRNRARITFTRAQFVSTVDDPLGTVFIQQSDDGRIFLERDLSLHVKLTWTLYGLERSHFFEKNNLEAETDRYIAAIGPTFDIDYRDNPFNPTTGSFTRLAAEYSTPKLGSDIKIEYLKADMQYTKYHKPFRQFGLVWANQIRGGYLTNLSKIEDSGVPFEKSFFLGGRSTIRGFEPAAERFPKTEELNYLQNSKFQLTTFAMPSRSQYVVFKSEVRFPIYGNFGGAIFYDGGAVYIDGFPIEDPYRDSVGGGLRFSTPVGPVNLEAGYKLDRKTKFKETPYRIHFSIGTF